MGAQAFGKDLGGDPGCDGWGYTARTPRFRFGYEIAGSAPIFCGTEKDRGTAEDNAKKKAGEVRFDLTALGASTGVSWWVQEGLSQTETTWEEPKVEPLC